MSVGANGGFFYGPIRYALGTQPSCGYARRLNMERLNSADVDGLPKKAIFEEFGVAGG